MGAATRSGGDGLPHGVYRRKVSRDEGAFIVGGGGKTKRKLSAVSGAQIDLQDQLLEIRGTSEQRARAKKYVDFVLKQRLGPVIIDHPEFHEDLTLLEVPTNAVSFVTGQRGSFLRTIEEEFTALLFFLEIDPKFPPTTVDPNRTERLAIFGGVRNRRGAELKAMSAVELKSEGFYSRHLQDYKSEAEGFDTDRVAIDHEDFSYAFGKSGCTRKKIARASGALVEYVGLVGHFSGTLLQRRRAKEYLTWILWQRVGRVFSVEHLDRDDITVIEVPQRIAGFVAGNRGSALRVIEEATGTFCLIENGYELSPEVKSVLIFGRSEDRHRAEDMVYDRLFNKVDEAVGG